jgi:hypothetical protein
VGKAEVIRTYQPLAEIGNPLPPGIDLAQYEKALTLFEAKQLHDARTEFAKISEDPLAAVYLKRLTKELEHPTNDWSPVWNMTEK